MQHLLYALLGLLAICGLFFAFEKPLRRLYFRASDRCFKRRTGIDSRQFPNPFE